MSLCLKSLYVLEGEVDIICSVNCGGIIDQPIPVFEVEFGDGIRQGFIAGSRGLRLHDRL